MLVFGHDEPEPPHQRCHRRDCRHGLSAAAGPSAVLLSNALIVPTSLSTFARRRPLNRAHTFGVTSSLTAQVWPLQQGHHSHDRNS